VVVVYGREIGGIYGIVIWLLMVDRFGFYGRDFCLLW